MQFVSDQHSKGLGVISPPAEMEISQGEEHKDGLEVLGTPGQADFSWCFPSFLGVWEDTITSEMLSHR